MEKEIYMALTGEWGCFVHVPKTGGQYVRRVLNTTIRTGREDGPSHGFPTEHKYDNVFSFVREPAPWYRSYWGHRFRDSFDKKGNPGDFRRSTNDSEAWNTLVTLTLPYMDTDFDKFVENVTTWLQGIYTWFVWYYFAPHVTMRPFEFEADDYLRRLGANPDKVDIVNSGISRMEGVADYWPLEISEETRNKIIKAEPRIYKRWYSSMIDTNPTIS
jgi:hypothetical protein